MSVWVQLSRQCRFGLNPQKRKILGLAGITSSTFRSERHHVTQDTGIGPYEPTSKIQISYLNIYLFSYAKTTHPPHWSKSNILTIHGLLQHLKFLLLLLEPIVSVIERRADGIAGSVMGLLHIQAPKVRISRVPRFGGRLVSPCRARAQGAVAPPSVLQRPEA